MSNRKTKSLRKKRYLKAQNGERSCGGGKIQEEDEENFDGR
jgi:hypothetical protein